MMHKLEGASVIERSVPVVEGESGRAMGVCICVEMRSGFSALRASSFDRRESRCAGNFIRLQQLFQRTTGE